MTYDTVNSSRQEGDPIVTFEFQIDSSYFLYTNADDPIPHDVYPAEEYEPVPIRFPSVTTTGNLDDSTVEVAMSQRVDFVDRYLVYPPSRPVNVICRYRHLSDTQFRHGFSGRVLSCEREGVDGVFTCEPNLIVLERPAFHRNYQFSCPRMVYDSAITGCRADKVRATRAVIAGTVTANFVDLTPGWEGSFQIEDYLNGEASWTNSDGWLENQTILGVSASQIRLGGLTRDLVATQTLSVTLGCRRNESDCRNLHRQADGSSVIRWFGGMPGIPSETLHGFTNNFY